MFIKLRPILFWLAMTPFAVAADKKNCGCECCKGKDVCCCVDEEPGTATTTPGKPSYTLRGVIVAVQVADSTLTVKHEAIPGVMRAMTMVFKVDAPVIQAVKKGQTITATMSRISDDWWLHDVKPAGKET